MSGIEDDRDERIAELEARLSRRPSVGVKPPVALAALVGACALLWMQQLDATYYFSSKEPISLGAEGDYHFDRAASNRYAEVRGVPTLRGAYGEEGGKTFVIVGLRDTPLLVKRATLDTERWTPGRTAPQPDQRPFAVRGRLLAKDDAEVYQDGFKRLEEMGEVKPRWILIESDRPGTDFKAAAWVGGIGAFAALNLWFLLRGLAAFFDRGQKTKTPAP
jgi:hypothetical protein